MGAVRIDQEHTFGSLLLRYRKAAGLSQVALAEAAGISTIAVSSYERGVRNAPAHATVNAIAAALNLSDLEKSGLTTASRPTRRPRRSRLVKSSLVGNLPEESTSFVGRAAELARIATAIASSRLLTLTGEGGMGKTRTAREAARRFGSVRADGAWILDFGTLQRNDAVVAFVASVFGVSGIDDETGLGRLADSLRSRDMLVIADGCEHVLDAVRTVVSTIQARCPNISIIATSRERLHLTGEVIFALDPLPIPAPDIAPADARTYPSVSLFIERGRAADSTLTFTDRQVESIADVCRRLEGIPLLIELAAAHVPMLGLSALRQQIDQYLPQLSDTYRDRPERQRTVQATLRWSYDLLDSREQRVYQRLSVFRGGWTAATAQDLLGDEHMPPADVDSILARLVETSIIRIASFDPFRYTMLELHIAFASHLASTAGILHETLVRHAHVFADLAAQATGLTHDSAWDPLFAPELGNAQAAIEYCLTPAYGDHQLAARILVGLQHVWLGRGLVRELAGWFSLIEVDYERWDPAFLADILRTKLHVSTGAARVEIAQRIITLVPAADFKRNIKALTSLAYAQREERRLLEAQTSLVAAFAIMDDLARCDADRTHVAYVQQADVFTLEGRYTHARSMIERATEPCVMQGQESHLLHLELLRAEIEFQSGDVAAAVERTSKAAQSVTAHSTPRRQMYFACNEPAYRSFLGDFDGAAERAAFALRTAGVAEPSVISSAALTLAMVAAQRGDIQDSIMLRGFVEERSRRGQPVPGPTELRVIAFLNDTSARGGDDLGRDELTRRGAAFDDVETLATALAVSNLRAHG